MSAFEETLRRAEIHLAENCPHMRRLISALGPCRLQTQPDGFQMLVRSITSQQISSAAARAIRRRLEGLVAPDPLSPQAVLAVGEARMRGVGYSKQKASYLISLTSEVVERGLDLASLADLDDDDVIARLTRVRGIGVWTAQMFLIFSLGRPDVLPYGDLGVRQALRQFHDLAKLPGKRQCTELAAPWRPYASVASWYCWRSVDARAAGESA